MKINKKFLFIFIICTLIHPSIVFSGNVSVTNKSGKNIICYIEPYGFWLKSGEEHLINPNISKEIGYKDGGTITSFTLICRFEQGIERTGFLGIKWMDYKKKDKILKSNNSSCNFESPGILKC
jgi:hypothetical protein